MTTTHPRLAASRLLVAYALTRDRNIPPRPDPHDAATWLLDQLQTAGWRPPPDPAADIPPLRPDRVATDAERRAAMTAIRAALADPPTSGTGQINNHSVTLTTSAEAPVDSVREVNA